MGTLCKFLLGVIGFGLFFYMMICGWGLSVKAIWPIIIYYVFWFISLLVILTIDQVEQQKKDK